MSASRPGNMRSPWVTTPLSLLLLLLLTTLTGKVFCQDEEENESTGVETGTEEEEVVEPETEADGDTTTPVPDATSTPDSSLTEAGTSDPANEEEEKQGSGDEGEKKSRSFDNIYGEIPSTSPMYPDDVTFSPEEDEGLSLIIIVIPVVVVVIIIGMIVCGIFINRRWNQKVRNQELGKEDPYLDGSSTEKVPMPMFEEDVPSVLELEMEELDQWMKKDGETAEDCKHT